MGSNSKGLEQCVALASLETDRRQPCKGDEQCHSLLLRAKMANMPTCQRQRQYNNEAPFALLLSLPHFHTVAEHRFAATLEYFRLSKVS